MVAKALIIGCGYIGTALAQLWVSQGINVTGTTTQLSRVEQLNQQGIHGALYTANDVAELRKLMQGKDTVVITVAAKGKEAYHTTYLDTATTVAAALKDCPKVKSVIYTSSTSVYGDHNGNWVDETTELRPQNEQAQILIQTEQVLLNAKPPACIFRLGEIIGPGRSPKDRLKNNTRPFAGTGQNYTNFSERDAIVAAIDFAARNGLSGIYNLCSDLHVTRKEYYGPSVEWDGTQTTVHGGNKRVSSKKYQCLVEE